MEEFGPTRFEWKPGRILILSPLRARWTGELFSEKLPGGEAQSG